MKNPNGYGSVYKLSGKRRRPWTARITVGWTFNEEKRKSYPKYKFLGYYETRQDAMICLAEYNKNPYDFGNDAITFDELYKKWSEFHFPRVSHSNVTGYKASYRLCGKIVNLSVRDIRLEHLQKIVDESGKNTPTLKKLKIMLGLMYEYGVVNELVTQEKREMIRHIDIKSAGNPNGFDRTPFTAEEIQLLWDASNEDNYYQIPLILIYTGLRISEFWNLKKEDVHLEDRWFQVTKSKTESGIREVPINEKIVPFFQEWMKNKSDYVFCTRQQEPFTDNNFRNTYWKPMMNEFGFEHKPHDCRHTCISLLTKSGIDERIIKKIVGHAGKGVTESVYTHIDLQTKLDAINRI